MFQEFMALNLCFLQWGLAGLGLGLVFEKVFKTRPYLDTVSLSSIASILSLSLFMFASYAPLPLLGIFSTLFLGLQGAGASRLGIFFKKASHQGWPRILSFLFFFLCAEAFWLHNMRDLWGLPSHHDGTAHMAFFLRILTEGSPLIFKLPNDFKELFGEGILGFYPAGSHSLAALFDVWWIRLGFMTPALAIKSWMLFACTSAPLLAFWASRRLFASQPLLFHYAIGFMGIALYQFPFWAADNGGFSRLLAHVIMFPLVVDALKLRFDFLAGGRRLSLLVVSLCMPAMFYLHPACFGMSCFSFGLVILDRIWEKRRRGLAREVAASCLMTLAGVGLTFIILLTSNSFTEVDYGDPRKRNLVFTWDAWWERLSDFLVNLFSDFRGASFVDPSALEVIRFVGLFGIFCLPFLPRLIRLYPAWLLGIGLAVLNCAYTDNRLLKLIGELFYNHPSRLSETFFLVHIILWGMGLLLILKLGRWFFERSLYVGRVRGVVAAALGIWLLVDVRYLAHHNRGRISHYYDVYKSPRKSQTADLVSFIINKTPKDSVLIYPPMRTEFLPVVTERHGLFMYLECPTFEYRTQNCAARMSLYDRVEKELKNISETSFLTEESKDCLDGLSRFNKPTFLVIPQDVLPLTQENLKVCRNLKFHGVKNHYAVLEYNPQTGIAL